MLAAVLSAGQVHAQDQADADHEPVAEASSDFDLTLVLASDYRFRGTSYSDGDPALLVDATWQLAPQLQVGAELANVRFGDDSAIEASATIGWQTSTGGTQIALEARPTTYIGISGGELVELALVLNRGIGPFIAEAEFVYVPMARDHAYRGMPGPVSATRCRRRRSA